MPDVSNDVNRELIIALAARYPSLLACADEVIE